MRVAFSTRTAERTYDTVGFPVDGGLEWLWRMVCGELRNDEGGLTDHLGKGRIIVGNGRQSYQPSDERLAGDQTAWAELDEPPVVKGGRLEAQATFGPDAANFRWLELGLTTVQGVLLVRAVADQDFKLASTIRTVAVTMELTADFMAPRQTPLMALL